MPVVNRRRVGESKVVRRRDRVAEEPEDETEEEEDIDVTQRSAARTRAQAPEPEDDDAPDEEFEDDEDEEEERPRARTPKKAAPAKKAAKRSSRPTRAVAEDDDEDEDDEPDEAPRTRGKMPPGIHTGWTGVDETKGGRGDFLRLTNKPELVVFLEKMRLASYRQHWVAGGGGGGQQFPHVCPGAGCPLCAAGSNSSQSTLYNVLWLSSGGDPANRVLQLATKANEALREAVTDRTSGRIKLMGVLASVNRSGKNQQSQTNFNVVKRRDLEDDWSELLDFFNPAELDELIAEAQDNLYDVDIIRTTPMRELRELSKYLSEED